jgi:hypothetical protein
VASLCNKCGHCVVLVHRAGSWRKLIVWLNGLNIVARSLATLKCGRSVSAMAEVGADPALIYAFQKTGVYVLRRERAAFIEAQIGSVARRNRRVSQRTRRTAAVTVWVITGFVRAAIVEPRRDFATC